MNNGIQVKVYKPDIMSMTLCPFKYLFEMSDWRRQRSK